MIGLPEVAPTKGNLLRLKERLKLARSGYSLLERKRNVLLRELISILERARRIQDEILDEFERAYKSLQMANLDLGMEYMDEVSRAVPEYEGLSIRMRSVMGVEVPEFRFEKPPSEIPYGLYRSNSALDSAYLSFRKLVELIAEAAWIENTAYRLAYEIRKTRKRVNALENVIIPRLESQIKEIQETLEEMEREEFVRVKKIKEYLEKT